MSLQSLPSSDLLSKVRALAVEERRVTLEVLHHLREVERRMLYAELGYASLYDFAMRELGYSGGAAHRRIEAMRLMREVPEVEARIQSGEIALSHAAQAGMFFKAERKEGRPHDLETKRAVLAEIAGKSTREVEHVLAVRSGQVGRVERIDGDAELAGLLGQLKDLVAHPGDPNPSDAAVLKKAIRFYLEKNRKHPRETVKATPAPGNSAEGTVTSRYVSVAGRGELAARAQGRCEFVSEQGVRCIATRGLQIEHVWPFAKGGGNEVSNLQLLCPGHQRLRAVQAYGVERMKRYIGSLK